MTEPRAPELRHDPALDPRTGLEVLPRDECVRLLGAHALGRLAVVVGGRPLVFPVNYTLDGGSIVFRTDTGTKLFGAVPEHDVAFEIDGSDALYHTGWSVLVVGTGREVTDPVELSRLTHVRLGPWCPGPKAHWVRIRPQAITGRRILLHHEDAGG